MTNNSLENSLLYHWLKNLVGSSTLFSFNLFTNLTAGLLFSFKVFTSPYLLLLFGVFSPILFTLCLYNFIRKGSGIILNESFPKAFVSKGGSLLLMTFDICLIIGFALLIYFGPLNYFLFRFLQTVFFPGMMLVFLRLLYISRMIENNEGESDYMI